MQVDIKLTKATLDVLNTYRNVNTVGSTLPGILDLFKSEGVDATTTPLAGLVVGTSSVWVNYAGGGIGTFTGVQQGAGDAHQGSVRATDYAFSKADHYTLHARGDIRLDYAIPEAGSPTLKPSAQGATYTHVDIASTLLPWSPNYNTRLGNVRLSADGSFTVSPSGEYNGTLTKLTASADMFLGSISLEGKFTVTNSTDYYAFLNPNYTAVLNAYNEDFRDGSYVHISDAAAHTNIANASDYALLSAGNLAGNDVFNINLPDEFDSYAGRSYAGFESGDGDDIITLKGGNGNIIFDAGNGNDQITLMGGNQQVSGGAGFDTLVQPGARANYVVKGTARVWDPHYDIGGQPPIYPNQFSIANQGSTLGTMSGVERIVFADGAIALDLDGAAGQAYRLYQAAFNRSADNGGLDKVGLGYWINALDHGMSLVDVAGWFIASDEFKANYSPSLSNHDLVVQFYHNILHREPEAEGLGFWTNVLDTHAASLATVLAAISESKENKVGLVGVIENGIEYVPYHAG